jgi:hypothetical protein
VTHTNAIESGQGYEPACISSGTSLFRPRRTGVKIAPTACTFECAEPSCIYSVVSN